MRPQNSDYSDKMDIWYARDVYLVGRTFLMFWVLGGLAALVLFGVVVLCLALSGGASTGPVPPWVARSLLGWMALLTGGVFVLQGLARWQHFRYWLLGGLGVGGPLVLVYLLWSLRF